MVMTPDAFMRGNAFVRELTKVVEEKLKQAKSELWGGEPSVTITIEKPFAAPLCSAVAKRYADVGWAAVEHISKGGRTIFTFYFDAEDAESDSV